MGKPPPPLRLTRPTEPEQGLHEAVAKLLAAFVLKPARWTCFPAGNIPLPPQWQAKLYRMGLQSGWPDFLIIHGKIHGVELKRLGARPSRSRYVRTRRGSLRFVEGQEDTLAGLEAAGMEVAVCHDIDDVIACLQGWSIPLRPGLIGGTQIGKQSPKGRSTQKSEASSRPPP